MLITYDLTNDDLHLRPVLDCQGLMQMLPAPLDFAQPDEISSTQPP